LYFARFLSVHIGGRPSNQVINTRDSYDSTRFKTDTKALGVKIRPFFDEEKPRRGAR
jgi:hypothetical protein